MVVFAMVIWFEFHIYKDRKLGSSKNDSSLYDKFANLKEIVLRLIETLQFDLLDVL